MIKSIGQYLSRHRRSFWVRKFHDALLDLHKGLENQSYRSKNNGEKWVLERIAEVRDVRTVFDVGANKGDWTLMAHKLFPAADIHAFEIVPDTFKKLSQLALGQSKIHANGVGLSDQAKDICVYLDATRPKKATAVDKSRTPSEAGRLEIRELPATTGEKYCGENGISHIDFLKIDVEGHEPCVLWGFENMLKKGAIDVVQFEYGLVNIDTKFLLKDFYDYFSRLGMSVGKIYPNHVDFRPYRRQDENFVGPNFLAVCPRSKEIISVLENR